MIRISTSRDPVTVQLLGAFETVGLTLRRLTSADFAWAGAAALAILNDGERLETVMAANGLMPEGGPEAWRALARQDPVSYAATMTGVATWVAGTECCVRAVLGWTGIGMEDGTAAPVTREVIQSLMLNEDFSDQVLKAIDGAAILISAIPEQTSGQND